MLNKSQLFIPVSQLVLIISQNMIAIFLTLKINDVERDGEQLGLSCQDLRQRLADWRLSGGRHSEQDRPFARSEWNTRLTLTLGSVRLVHMDISSLVDMSGYLFLANKASSSWSCWEVK